MEEQDITVRSVLNITEDIPNIFLDFFFLNIDP